MTIKPGKWIRRMAQEHGMIEPFVERQVRGTDDSRVISYEVSSYDYDVHRAVEFKMFTNIHSAAVNPKNFDERSFVDISNGVCIIPSSSSALARTVEYFRTPRDILTTCLGKSTHVRCGIIVNTTPLEPEWEGYVTLELSNATDPPVRIYANEGVAQMFLPQFDEACEMPYKSRGDKCQGQRGVTLPKA